MLPSPMEIRVVGVTFRGADYPQNIFAVGEAVAYAQRPLRATLVREPDNPVDSNAMKVMVGTTHLGYIPADTAVELSAEIDAGAKWLAIVDRMIISPEHPDQPGLRLKVFRNDI